MNRRLFIVMGLVAGSLAVAAAAHAEDLEDYLEHAANAEYGGSAVVVTTWQGESTVGFFEFERSGGVMMFGDDGDETVAGEGKMNTGSSAVVLAEWAGAHVSDRYTTGESEPVRHLGRDAIAVTIYEGDVERVRLVLDAATSAPLSTEVFDADGETFRHAALTSFDPTPRLVYSKFVDGSARYEVVSRTDASTFPEAASHYARLDVYRDQDGVIQAFYGDGLFSFSVFRLDGVQVKKRFETAETLLVGDERYQMLVHPTDVWVRWVDGNTTYMLVGNLPPDHLERVLTTMPTPDGGNLLSRWWRGLFGG